MSILAVDATARASHVRVTRDQLIVDLKDGRTVSVPPAWFPKLLHATVRQRRRWELLAEREGIRWPEVDEDLSVAGLLRGTPAPQIVTVKERCAVYGKRAAGRRSRSKSPTHSRKRR